MNLGKIGTLVIYPKGSLYERIDSMLSIKIISDFLNVNVQMIWDHDVPYHVLFLDNIGLVKFELYESLLKNNINGMILGQLNLFDIPIKPFYFIDNFTNIPSDNKLIALPMMSTTEFTDAKNVELQEYLQMLIYSKATCLVCTEKKIPDIFIKACQISLIPIICLNNECNDNFNNETLLKSSCKNYMGYPLIINPDLEKISLFR